MKFVCVVGYVISSSKAFYSAADVDHCPHPAVSNSCYRRQIRVMHHDVPWPVSPSVLGFRRIVCKFYISQQRDAAVKHVRL